jgi:AcrR family transcriptional regulator
VGYHRTSVADIAAKLGMSPANIYRFFPSRDAINESICGRVVNEVAEIAFAIARTNAPAMEKLEQLLTAVHHHNKMMLVKARPPAHATCWVQFDDWMRGTPDQAAALMKPYAGAIEAREVGLDMPRDAGRRAMMGVPGVATALRPGTGGSPWRSPG